MTGLATAIFASTLHIHRCASFRDDDSVFSFDGSLGERCQWAAMVTCILRGLRMLKTRVVDFEFQISSVLIAEGKRFP